MRRTSSNGRRRTSSNGRRRTSSNGSPGNRLQSSFTGQGPLPLGVHIEDIDLGGPNAVEDITARLEAERQETTYSFTDMFAGPLDPSKKKQVISKDANARPSTNGGGGASSAGASGAMPTRPSTSNANLNTSIQVVNKVCLICGCPWCTCGPDCQCPPHLYRHTNNIEK